MVNNSMSFDRDDSILIYAGGGGGDVATAGYLCRKLDRWVRRVYISALPWERFTIDPIPGPIRGEELRNVRRLGDFSYIIYKDAYAMRNNNKVIFQASRISKALETPIYIVTGEYGVQGIYSGLKEIVEYLNIDHVVGLDVGGDVLAIGYEGDLWSPLADQMMLSALYRLEESGVSTSIAVSSPGSDGELSMEYVLERIRSISLRKGLHGIIGFGHNDLDYINYILENVFTEASLAVKYALEGRYGEFSIRNATRKVKVDWISTLVFFLNTLVVYNDSLIASKILKSRSIEEANNIVRMLGIPTEYSIEKLLYERLSEGREINKSLVMEIWESLKSSTE